MKNKLLSVIIASALSTLWGTNLMAAGNSMSVTQTDSVGSVTGEQKAGAANSHIGITQTGSDATSSVSATQTGTSADPADPTDPDYKKTSIMVEQTNGVGSTVTIGQSGKNNTTAVNQTDVGGGANENNHLGITQGGNDNKVTGYNDTATSATQTGTDNAINVLDQAGDRNTMGFTQNGNANTTHMTQDATSTDSEMNVKQVGNANTVDAEQLDTADSSVDLDIEGNSNTITASQSSSGSHMTVDIKGKDALTTGDNNMVSMTQATGADNSDMTLAQNGSNNSATMKQGDADHNAASGNDMTLTQNNDYNTATLTQFGQGNSMNFTQSGGTDLAPSTLIAIQE